MDYEKMSFRDFEDIPGYDVLQRAAAFNDYLDFLDGKGHLNYRLKATTGCGPEVILAREGLQARRYVSMVSNDYLGFTQHPKVVSAAMEGIRRFGTGAGASPAIGGHFSFHEELENRTAAFFRKESAITYTTGYTANSASLQALLRRQDIAILDMAVHASIYEGCQLTNTKKFRHNDLEDLERILVQTKDHYRTRLVVIDGVYSQDGDLAPLRQIAELVKMHGALLMMDDAHGTGVLGKTGRGLIELEGVFDEVDLISGTFSKALAHIGGYVAGRAEVIRYLKFQSRQHLFSVTATPASACIVKSMELLEEEPEWMDKLDRNAAYLKKGLRDLGLDIGNTASAIIPVKIGDPDLTREAGRLLLDAGIYANPITYPAVSLKDARVRMSVMATHTQAHLDQVLNAYEDVGRKLRLSRKMELI